MSDEEAEYSEEEVEEPKSTASGPTKKEDVQPDFVRKQQQKASELDEQLRDYIEEWRKQRRKEEEELKRLKEKQSKRKVLREQQEKALEAKKIQEEKERQAAVEDKKRKDQEEKMRRLQEAEKKRQQMMSDGGKQFGANASVGQNPALELQKTKEQLAEEKKISLSFRIKSLDIEGLGLDALKKKAKDLWEQIIKLETEKYDLEDRQKRQDYDLKELQERKKQQLRQKALKLGLNPEALTGKYPPKIRLASKFERRVDTRSYEERKSLFEGGYAKITKETNDKLWQERMEEYQGRQKVRLPKWFGERPGKKKNDPPTPEEEAAAEAADVLQPLALDEPSFYEEQPIEEDEPEEDKTEAAEAEEEEEEVEEEEEEEEE